MTIETLLKRFGDPVSALEKFGHQPVTLAALVAALRPLIERFGEMQKQLTERVTYSSLDSTVADIQQLKSRVASLEVQPKGILQYRGTFSDGARYAEGDTVTHQGSLWLALESTMSRPGEPGAASRCWRLIVKRGGEGKQGPPGPPGRDAKDLT
jgi:hypothetical protein